MMMVLDRAGTNESVGMGQVALARKPTTLTAVLGSCVGVAIYDARLQLGALGHIVLPSSTGRSGPPGKFADTAIPHMVQRLQAEGARQACLLARIAGGACMFGVTGPMQIGRANAEGVVAALAALGIPLVGQDVGGEKGRRVAFDCATGRMRVEIAGGLACVL